MNLSAIFYKVSNVPAPVERNYDTGVTSFFRTVPLNGIPVESFELYINVLKYVCATELLPFW